MFVAENGKMTALGYLCLVILACFLLKNISRYMALYQLASIRNGVVETLRNDIYAKMLSLDLSFFSEERKGDIQARLMNDVQEIQFSIVGAMELLFREPLAIILTLTALFAISWKLTLFSLILLPVSAFIISRIGKSLKRSSARAQERLGALSSTLEETLSGVRIIKAFNAERIMVNHFKKVNHDYKSTSNKVYRKRDLASPLNEMIGAIVMIALVWFAGSIVLEERGISAATFLGFIITFSQLLIPIQGVANSLSNVNKTIPSIDRVNKILDADVHINDPENPLELSALKEGIRYDNVSFSYDGTTPVLSNINVDIPKGRTVALVGESGGGKSTMADLLPRFFDVSGGAIMIDGKDIRQVGVADLRNLMGIVTQESILFNDSIRNNIAFGMETATNEQIMEAARIANAHDFIMEFPEGYNTNIGDRGSKLSGGQRQRLSIARAVLKNPDILILDEATSALDTESEALVQQALEKLMENRTSLVIAHRLSTIKHADEILVLQQGQVVERGKHTELFDMGGVYRKLCDLQSFS